MHASCVPHVKIFADDFECWCAIQALKRKEEDSQSTDRMSASTPPGSVGDRSVSSQGKWVKTLTCSNVGGDSMSERASECAAQKFICVMNARAHVNILSGFFDKSVDY